MYFIIQDDSDFLKIILSALGTVIDERQKKQCVVEKYDEITNAYRNKYGIVIPLCCWRCLLWDESSHASSSKLLLILALESLFEFYDENCQIRDLYVPLMGTGFSRAELPEESLRVIKTCVELNAEHMRGNVNI